MSTQHHQLIREVRARNIAKHVAGLLNCIADLVAYLDLYGDGDVALKDAVHAVVVLGVHRNDG